MASDTRNLPVADLQPGMQLGADIVDGRGNVLLASGTTLGEAAIESLQRHGFEHVVIAAAETSVPIDAATKERMSARLAHLFRNSLSAGAAAELMAQMKRYRGLDDHD